MYRIRLVIIAIRMTTCSRFMLKTQAAMPTANPPEPSAVRVMTLNVFQIPQAYASVIAENGPSPPIIRNDAMTSIDPTSKTRKNICTLTSGAS
jgi:hypothetical protein